LKLDTPVELGKPDSIAGRLGWRIAADACTLSVFGLGWLAIANRHKTAVFLSLVVLAGLLDGLDGALARRSGKPALHGAVLDIVADATAFGLAPLVFCEFRAGLSGALLVLTAVVYMAAAIGRLVRSARRYRNKPCGYIGFPMPGTGALLSGLAIVLPAATLCVTALGLSALAISRISYPTLLWLWQNERRRFVLAAVLAAALALFYFPAGWLAALLSYAVYPWLRRQPAGVGVEESDNRTM
jgi:phosphatidylserine synthase